MQYQKTEGRKWGHQDPRHKADNLEEKKNTPPPEERRKKEHVSISGCSKIREVIYNMIVTLE